MKLAQVALLALVTQVLAAPTAETRDDSSGKSLGTITTKAEYLALHANHRLVHNNGNFIALDVGTNDFWQVGDPLLSDVKSAWTSFTPPTTSVKRDAVSLEGKRDSPGSYCNGGQCVADWQCSYGCWLGCVGDYQFSFGWCI